MAEREENKWENRMIKSAMVVVALGAAFALIMYLQYAYNIIILPLKYVTQDVAETATLGLSIVGAILGFIAIFMYVKVEKEIAQRKIEEKNIEKEIARKELLAIIRNFDLFYDTLEKIIQVAEKEGNIDLVYEFIKKWYKDLDEALKNFIRLGGHLKDIRDLKSKYKGYRIKLDISEIHKFKLPRILLDIIKEIEKIQNKNFDCRKKEFQNELKRIINEIKNNYNAIENIELKESESQGKFISEFSSDDILNKINELKVNTFIVENMPKNYIISDNNSIKLDNKIIIIFNDTRRRSYELYLMLAYNITIECDLDNTQSP